MKSLVVATLKGGVGKTSVLSNIAGVMAVSGKRVLVMDMDAQSNLTIGMGVDVLVAKCRTTVDLFEKEGEINAESLIVKTKHRNIDIIPASIFLVSTELKIAPLSGREMILKNWFKDNQVWLSSNYDYVMLDTNPSFNIVNQNAFIASDSILLVSDVGLNSYEGAQQFTALWKDIRRRLRIDENIKALIINNFDKRIKLAGEYIEYLQSREDFASLLVLPAIPYNVKVKESEMDNTPLAFFSPGSPPAKAYKDIIEVLLARGVL